MFFSIIKVTMTYCNLKDLTKMYTEEDEFELDVVYLLLPNSYVENLRHDMILLGGVPFGCD